MVIPSNPGLLPRFLPFFLGLTRSLSFEEVRSLTWLFWYFSSPLHHPPFFPSSSVLAGDEKHYFTEILHPWGHCLAFGRRWYGKMLLRLPNHTNYFRNKRSVASFSKSHLLPRPQLWETKKNLRVVRFQHQMADMMQKNLLFQTDKLWKCEFVCAKWLHCSDTVIQLKKKKK